MYLTQLEGNFSSCPMFTHPVFLVKEHFEDLFCEEEKIKASEHHCRLGHVEILHGVNTEGLQSSAEEWVSLMSLFPPCSTATVYTRGCVTWIPIWGVGLDIDQRARSVTMRPRNLACETTSLIPSFSNDYYLCTKCSRFFEILILKWSSFEVRLWANLQMNDEDTTACRWQCKW